MTSSPESTSSQAKRPTHDVRYINPPAEIIDPVSETTGDDAAREIYERTQAEIAHQENRQEVQRRKDAAKRITEARQGQPPDLTS